VWAKTKKNPAPQGGLTGHANKPAIRGGHQKPRKMWRVREKPAQKNSHGGRILPGKNGLKRQLEKTATVQRTPRVTVDRRGGNKRGGRVDAAQLLLIHGCAKQALRGKASKKNGTGEG